MHEGLYGGGRRAVALWHDGEQGAWAMCRDHMSDSVSRGDHPVDCDPFLRKQQGRAYFTPYCSTWALFSRTAVPVASDR